jgi:non-specific serine/threonine protein kinase
VRFSLRDPHVPTETPSVARVSAQLTPLPRHLTRFIGREWELAEIRRALERHRLVTLTGGGGSGKTRLAAEIAGRAADSLAEGVVWVDLAPLSDPALVARHVCAAMGYGESLERSPLDTLIDMIRPTAPLIVLDNCEHLVAECASLVHSLLRECPGLRVLATSREALGVDGEVAWIVPPLSLPASADPPTAEGTTHSEAVQLFVGRAQAVQPGFVLTNSNAPAVAQICLQLAGLPLAIELAAARLNVLSVEQIAKRLDDVFGLLTTRSRTAPPRHRTLRDAIDWSYELLDEEERRLFRRLAVFVGGFTLDAAEGVCASEDIVESDVLDLVSALVDKSLVRAEALQDEARFSLLEPVRQYAWEKLAEAGEAEKWRARHFDYFLALAEGAEPHVRGGTRGTEWMVRLERDHGNLRAAAEWCGADEGLVEGQLRLDSALLWFYFALGLFREPRQRLTRGLARAQKHFPFVPSLVLGRAHTALGYQAIWQGDFGAVAGPLVTAISFLHGGPDRAALAFAQTGLGAVVGLGGDAAGAHALFDEAQTALGGRDGAFAEGFPAVLLYAFASYWRGVVSLTAGDLVRARESFETGIGAARVFHHHSIAHPLAGLARVHTLTGDFAAARACLAESIPVHAAHDDRWGLSDALEGAAHLAAAEGAWERAAKILGAVDDVRDSTGIPLPPHLQSPRGQLIGIIRSAIGAAAFDAAHVAGHGMTLPQLMAEALGTPSTLARPASKPAPSEPPPREASSSELTVDPEADLCVLALGPLQVLRGGKPLEPGDWGSAKPRELLLYLLCHPDGATREQVGLALWPESSSERVSNSFHVTMHRLRKALGDASWIVKVNDRYVVSPDIRCVFDARVFEDEVSAALDEMHDGRSGVDRLQAVLEMYRGAFLDEEVVGDWHLEVRDRLARIHVEAQLALAAELGEHERYAEAAEAYWRVIGEDDLHEAAYRQLMTCLARAGDRSQALRLYQRLETLLAQELGVEPERETTALYERLRQAETV